jgi:hypothetical protein
MAVNLQARPAMTKPSEESKHERYEASGYVVTRGCRYLPDLRRWEPQVSIHASRDASSTPIELSAKPEEFQDTPEDAMRVAATMASDWLDANRRDDPTVDAAA